VEEQNRRFGKKAILISTVAIISIAIVFGAIFLQPISQHFGAFTVEYEFHCWIEHYDKDGNLLSITCHPMTMVNYGKNQTKELLGNETVLGFKYFCCSNDETAVDVTWTVLPSEIAANGLERHAATYLDTGLGTWNMTWTWTASGSQSACLYGVCSESTGSNLCLAEQQGSGARKNLVAGDTLKMTVQGTVS